MKEGTASRPRMAVINQDLEESDTDSDTPMKSMDTSIASFDQYDQNRLSAVNIDTQRNVLCSNSFELQILGEQDGQKKGNFRGLLILFEDKHKMHHTGTTRIMAMYVDIEYICFGLVDEENLMNAWVNGIESNESFSEMLNARRFWKISI